MQLVETKKQDDITYYDYVDGNKTISFYVVNIKPDIIYPECILNGITQNCYECDLLQSCDSPRSFCLHNYYNHPKGCPNFGKKEGCPPNVPMFDEVFNIEKSIFAIVTEFNFISHLINMRGLHPSWSEKNIENIRYYQGKMISDNNIVSSYYTNMMGDNIVLTNWIESTGINIVSTLDKNGIHLEFGPNASILRRITIGGSVLDNIDSYGVYVKEIQFRKDLPYVRVLSKK